MGHLDDTDIQRANARYIRHAMRAPLLSREEEFELARRWRESNDQAAMHRLTIAYMRLVVSTALRHRHYGLPVGDLIQEGNLGLMQAAARFEPARQVRFSTYAAWWIRAQMQDYVLRNWSIVRTGTTAAHKTLFFNLRRLRARLADGPEDALSPDARLRIARTLDVRVADVEEMEGRLSGADQSLNAPRAPTGDEWGSFLEDGRPTPEETAIAEHDARIRRAWLDAALGELSPRERTVIARRRLDDRGATLEALGRALGVSKERVRQIEKRALSKLRRALERRAQRADLVAPA